VFFDLWDFYIVGGFESAEMVGSNTPTHNKHISLMSYNKSLLETLIADCNMLRQQNRELAQALAESAQALTNTNLKIHEMEETLRVLRDTTPVGTDTLNLEDLMASLKDSQGDIEEAITDAIFDLDSCDLEEFIQVDLSLNGNEIETELETANRYAIERFVRNYISSQVMEKLEIGIAHYFEHLTPKADDTI
jgi:hypothetical protein